MLLSILALVTAGPVSREMPPGTVVMEVRGDLTGVGKECLVRLDTRNDPPLTIRSGARTVVVPIKRRWRPWKIALADVDGGGRREIAIALYKPTAYMPKPHNCLFLYRFDGAETYPRWQGSTLGRPFTDFAFVPAPDGDRLVTLDIWLDGRRGVTVHRWKGFGFRKVRSWGRWRRARLLRVRPGQVAVEADGRQIERGLEDGHEGVPGIGGTRRGAERSGEVRGADPDPASG